MSEIYSFDVPQAVDVVEVSTNDFNTHAALITFGGTFDASAAVQGRMISGGDIYQVEGINQITGILGAILSSASDRWIIQGDWPFLRVNVTAYVSGLVLADMVASFFASLRKGRGVETQ